MKFINENWQLVLQLLGLSTGGGLIGFFAGKKKRISDNKMSEAKALESTQSVYDTLTKHMDIALSQMKEEVNHLKKENVEQRKEMRALQSDNRKLHIEVTNMHKENNKLKEMVRKLSTENEKLYSELQKYKKK